MSSSGPMIQKFRALLQALTETRRMPVKDLYKRIMDSKPFTYSPSVECLLRHMHPNLPVLTEEEGLEFLEKTLQYFNPESFRVAKELAGESTPENVLELIDKAVGDNEDYRRESVYLLSHYSKREDAFARLVSRRDESEEAKELVLYALRDRRDEAYAFLYNEILEKDHSYKMLAITLSAISHFRWKENVPAARKFILTHGPRALTTGPGSLRIILPQIMQLIDSVRDPCFIPYLESVYAALAEDVNSRKALDVTNHTTVEVRVLAGKLLYLLTGGKRYLQDLWDLLSDSTPSEFFSVWSVRCGPGKEPERKQRLVTISGLAAQAIRSILGLPYDSDADPQTLKKNEQLQKLLGIE